MGRHAGTRDDCVRHIVRAIYPFVMLVSFACWRLVRASSLTEFKLVIFSLMFLVRSGTRMIRRRSAARQLVVAQEGSTVLPGFNVFPTKRENIFGDDESQ